MRYEAVLEIIQPERFDRAQIVLRFLVLIALSIMGVPLGTLIAIAYLVVPLLAASAISGRGGQRYIVESSSFVAMSIGYALDALAYLMLLTDRVPQKGEHAARFEVHPHGVPTVTSAMLRLLYSVPEAFLLLILGVVSGFFWVIAAVSVLISQSYPRAIYGFLRAVLRMVGRLFAYHASLVDRYPPFVLELESEAA